MIGLAAVGLVGLGIYLLFVRDQGVGDDLADSRSREDLARRVRDRQREGSGGDDILLGLSESDLAAGLALGGAGGAIAGAAFGAGLGGPIGAFIGFAVGVFAAEVWGAIAHESYPEVVRGAVKDWLRAEDYPATDANVDALLVREALLGAKLLYKHRDGRVAIQMVLHTYPNGETLLEPTIYTADRRDAPAKLIPGMARAQMQQQILLNAPGQLDGPGRRRLKREWEARAYEGALYVLQARSDAPISWRTPGYVHPKGNWPVVADEPTRLANEWTRVVPSPDNVDALCAWYDRARGASWERD